MIVRGWHFAFESEEDEAVGTLYYPGDDQRLAEARLTGRVPPVEAPDRWPVAVMMPGINMAPDNYRWLAHRLVGDGFCVVTYTAVGSLGPAGRGITPGIDMTALLPDTIGTRPSSTLLAPLLQRLAEATPDDSPVAGLLDLGSVVLGGHSAGGTVALHNSDPDWIPGLKAVFTYGAHTMTAAVLGHGESAVVAVPAKVPVMLLAGSADGVIAASSDRYRSADHSAVHDPVGRTFDEAVVRDRKDSWLVELADAGHFAICWPLDTTSGRAFLEADPAGADSAVRALLGDLIAAFAAASLGRTATTPLEQLAEHRLVGRWRRR